MNRSPIVTGETMREEAGDRRGGAPAVVRQTFLVVVRGEFTRHQIKAALRDDDRDVFLAATAKEGLQAIPDLKPELVLVGLNLPNLK